ncbi:hypothetical protein AC1031_015088 [Aphanomyces cochlioides]|nr:hypothetical protein AC1031_015088 [Aphanomyces cochlioides]
MKAPGAVATITALLGSCGGIGYKGPTSCVAGATCTKFSDYYSQCLPLSGAPPSFNTPPTSAAPAPSSSAPSSSAPAPSPSGYTSTYFGTATDNPAKYGTIVPDNFNLVSKNGMKWDAHERSRGVFDFSASLSEIAYAKQPLLGLAQPNAILLLQQPSRWHHRLRWHLVVCFPIVASD